MIGNYINMLTSDVYSWSNTKGESKWCNRRNLADY